MIEEENLGENLETVDATEEVEQQAEQQDNDELLQRAKELGYKDGDEYTGNPKYKLSPEEYIKRAEKGGTIKAQKAEIDSLRATVQETNEAVKRMGEFHKMQLKRTREEAIAEAKRKYAQSIQDDDIDPSIALDTYEKTRSNIEKSYSEPREEVKTVDAPEITKFYQENPWYNEDYVMQGAANAIHQNIALQYPTMSLQQQLDMVKRQVVERFPDKFENPKKKDQRIEGGGSVHAGGRQPSNTFRSIGLNEADIVDARKLIAQGLYKDEAEFVKDFKILNGVK